MQRSAPGAPHGALNQRPEDCGRGGVLTGAAWGVGTVGGMTHRAREGGGRRSAHAVVTAQTVAWSVPRTAAWGRVEAARGGNIAHSQSTFLCR
jgi:hypothetical protein